MLGSNQSHWGRQLQGRLPVEGGWEQNPERGNPSGWCGQQRVDGASDSSSAHTPVPPLLGCHSQQGLSQNMGSTSITPSVPPLSASPLSPSQVAHHPSPPCRQMYYKNFSFGVGMRSRKGEIHPYVLQLCLPPNVVPNRSHHS